MKLSRPHGIIISVLCALVLVSVPLAGVALAASSDHKGATKNSANGMTVRPVRTDLTIQPGKTKAVNINVTNDTDGTLKLEPIENDFVAGNEEGRPALILNKDSYAPTHSLKRFMIPIKPFTLAAGKTKTVRLQISVPPSAQAGGYFGALRFLPSGDSSQPVALNSSVASLVLLTVPGQTEHKLLLTDFKVQQNGDSAGIFGSFSKPDNLKLLVRFENEGNAQEAPFGQINVTKGGDQVYSYNFNQSDPRDEILPDSARRWNVPLKKIGNFGKYTVSGTFSYANGRSIQIDQSFWIIPKILFIVALAIIVAIILIIVGTRAFLKSYKRRVLSGRRR